MRPPKCAAKIWSVGDWLHLELPAINGLTSHTIRLPMTILGLEAALKTIHARELDPEPFLNKPSEPSQHTVDRMLRPKANAYQSMRPKATKRKTVRKQPINPERLARIDCIMKGLIK